MLYSLGNARKYENIVCGVDSYTTKLFLFLLVPVHSIGFSLCLENPNESSWAGQNLETTKINEFGHFES